MYGTLGDVGEGVRDALYMDVGGLHGRVADGADVGAGPAVQHGG